jgi:hypothetical protein
VKINCACLAQDRFECVAIRYRIPEADADDIEPCECACHDEDDDDC